MKWMRKVSVLVVALALSLGFALAADLGGTAWQLSGTTKDKVKKVGSQKDVLPETYMYFDPDGTCTIQVCDPDEGGCEGLPCTWESSEGSRKFTFQMDDDALEEILGNAFEDLVGAEPTDGTILMNRGKGKVSKDMSKIKLKLKLKASLTTTVEGETVTRKTTVKLKAKGTQINPK